MLRARPARFAPIRALLLAVPLALLVVGASAQAGAAAAPLFVGPGRVVLEGGVGDRDWRRIEFGTRAVRLTWDVLARRETCRVSVRVSSPSGERIAGRIIAVRGAWRSLGRATLIVDHASAGLTVRSSCPGWHLTMRGTADDLPVSTRIVRYWVTGDTPARIWSSMSSRSPWGWPGYTAWRWSSGCGDVSITVGLPRWNRPASTSDVLAARWSRFIHALRRHELGHATMVRQAVARRSGCVSVSGWDAVQARSDRYDALTDHGRTQGAWWSW